MGTSGTSALKPIDKLEIQIIMTIRIKHEKAKGGSPQKLEYVYVNMNMCIFLDCTSVTIVELSRSRFQV